MNKLKRGFTLIETLVVATIFSFIGLAIATSFISGVKIWDRARNTDFIKYNNLLSLEMIAKELRQSIDYPLIGFKVSAKEFSFLTSINDSMIKVTYVFDPEKHVLSRRQVGLKDIIANKEEEEVKEKIVLTSLEELSINYFYRYFDTELNREAYAWKEVKEGVTILPLAVKLIGKIKNESFSKTFFIPTS